MNQLCLRRWGHGGSAGGHRRGRWSGPAGSETQSTRGTVSRAFPPGGQPSPRSAHNPLEACQTGEFPRTQRMSSGRGVGEEGSLAWTLCPLLPPPAAAGCLPPGVPSDPEQKAGAESTKTLPSRHRRLPREAPKPVNGPNNRAEAPASRSKDESHPLSGPRLWPCSLRRLVLEEPPRAEPGPARPGSSAPPPCHTHPSPGPTKSPLCSRPPASLPAVALYKQQF